MTLEQEMAYVVHNEVARSDYYHQGVVVQRIVGAFALGLPALFCLLGILAAKDSDAVGSAVMVFFWLSIGIALYFLPSLIAGNRAHHQSIAIFVLNLVFGWTFIGWIASFIWAVTAVKSRRM
jgi:hypothetical protein